VFMFRCRTANPERGTSNPNMNREHELRREHREA